MHRSHLISLLNSCLLLLLTVSPAGAATFGERLQSVFGGGDTAATEYLDADEAFALSALAVSRSKVDVRWQIALGYYLYRDKMSFAVAGSGHVIDQAALVLPTGRAKTDEYFGDTEIYTNEVIVSVPLIAT
ncbi:MAG: protein-disulfide reductase DsbD domain-containing protein, partial [bacterium]